MKTEEAMKLVEEGIAALNDALRGGHSETLTRFLETLARFPSYSFNNALLIAMQRPDATRVAGFHAWKKFGRVVKKGEHGIAIFAPMIGRRKDQDARDQSTSDEKSALFGFRIAYVFDVEQTAGDPLPDFAQVSGDATVWLPLLEDAVREAGVVLEYGPIGFPGAKGMSTPGAITISPSLTNTERFAVLIHEFAHELLHQRTDRRSSTTKQTRETEAEAVAYTVCRAFGIDSTTHSSDYIQLYQGTEETLRESLAFVQQTATHIIQTVRSRCVTATEATTSALAA